MSGETGNVSDVPSNHRRLGPFHSLEWVDHCQTRQKFRIDCPRIRILILDIVDCLYVTIAVAIIKRVACWGLMASFWRFFYAARIRASKIRC